MRNSDLIEDIEFEEVELDLEDLVDDDDFEWVRLKVDQCTCGVQCKGLTAIKAFTPRNKYKQNEQINASTFEFIKENYKWDLDFG